MKRGNIAKTFALALVALALALPSTAKAAEKGCSNATLKGTFSDKDIGVFTAPNAAPIPFAAVNTITFDGNGNMAASGIGSVNGSAGAQTETGTYAVKPDCTGTCHTVLISPGGFTTHAFFVIDDSGNELADRS